jgi:hypothetical protein
VMDMETVYKTLLALSLHKFVLADITVMEMEIVFQIQFLLHARVDGKVMGKEVVFHCHQIHQHRFYLLKDVQIVNNQMEQVVVFHFQFIYLVLQDT